MKRLGTPAAEFLKNMTEAPRSARSIKTTFSTYNDPLHHRRRHGQGGNESVEIVDGTEVSLSYDSRADDTMDDGFEGLENVRACCNGKHDVGS